MKISNVTTWKSPPAEAQCEIPQQLLNFADSAIILFLITFTFYGPTDYNYFQGPCFYLDSATVALNDPLF